MRAGQVSRRPRSIPARSLLIAGALSLVASLAPAGAGTALGAYSYQCDGTLRNSHDILARNATNNPYLINEVVGFATAVHQYPCQSTGGGWGTGWDVPWILGANLQNSAAGTDGRIVQIGFGRCDSTCVSGWLRGQELLVWTASDVSGGSMYLATWWNQGLGAGVIREGDLYETAILPVDTNRWEYAVNDVSNSNGWTYHYATNGWPNKYGGKFAWWGAEVNNWMSVMGNRAIDTSFGMTTMQWRESDNNVVHYVSSDACYLPDPNPSYYGCGI